MRKKVPKKACGTATPGKSPLLPIFERGSSQCRAQNCWRVNSHVRARSCSLFSSFKKGKAFSLRCLSPLSPPRSAWGIRKPCGLGCFGVAGPIQQGRRLADFGNNAGLWREPRDLPSSGGLYRPTSTKPCQTREPRGPSPSGGISAAKLQSFYFPRPKDAVWGAGALPLPARRFFLWMEI